MKRDVVLVTGAGGFIGGHMVRALVFDGHRVRAVDKKPLDEWYQVHDAENVTLDLSDIDACRNVAAGVADVYNLAADMGGMGFIETHKADCMLSVLINTNLLRTVRDQRVRRFFFSSSACVYAAGRQSTPEVIALREGDAYPAMPEDGYGWEKLFSERMCRHFQEDYGVPTRVGRYHNVYGPFGTYRGGREKAPAAICRKVIEAQLSGIPEIEIWGDGEQTRSFMYIDDCVEGTLRLAASDVVDPLNIGSAELVTINELVDAVEMIAGVGLLRKYNPAAPQGVRGRNSDNAKIRSELGWEPSISLRDGLKRTYDWIAGEMGLTTDRMSDEPLVAEA
jgi:nucleoside-diphosphate-sugar epimerase